MNEYTNANAHILPYNVLVQIKWQAFLFGDHNIKTQKLFDVFGLFAFKYDMNANNLRGEYETKFQKY